MLLSSSSRVSGSTAYVPLKDDWRCHAYCEHIAQTWSCMVIMFSACPMALSSANWHGMLRFEHVQALRKLYSQTFALAL